MDRIWPAEEGDPHEGIEPLSDRDVPEALRAIRPPGGVFQLLVTPPQLDWHLERERIYSELLRRRRPPLCGARAGASTALWAAVFKQNELHVLLLDARTPGEARRLLQSARRAAHQAGLERVRWWQTKQPFEWTFGEAVERPGGLPMLCPLTGEVRGADWEEIPRALWV